MKYVFNNLVTSLETWKSENVEICLVYSYLTKLESLEIWKCGNMSLIARFLRLEVWKCGIVGICMSCI